MFAETTDVTVVDNVYILKSFILANFNQTWSCIIALHRRLYVTAVAYIYLYIGRERESPLYIYMYKVKTIST